MHQSIPCHRSLRVLLSEPSTVAFRLRIIEINLFYLTLKILLSSKSWSVFYVSPFLFSVSLSAPMLCVCHVASIFERSLRYFFLIFFFPSFSILSLDVFPFSAKISFRLFWLRSFRSSVFLWRRPHVSPCPSPYWMNVTLPSQPSICNLTPAAAKSETLPKPSKLSATTFLLDLGAGLSKICSL